MNNGSSAVTLNDEGGSLLSLNRALQGAFRRIEANASRSCTSYGDSSGEEGGWDDGDHSDGHDDSSEHDDSSV